MHKIYLRWANSNNIVSCIFDEDLNIAGRLKENDIHFRLPLVYKIYIFGLIFVYGDTFLAQFLIDVTIDETYSKQFSAFYHDDIEIRF